MRDANRMNNSVKNSTLSNNQKKKEEKEEERKSSSKLIARRVGGLFNETQSLSTVPSTGTAHKATGEMTAAAAAATDAALLRRRGQRQWNVRKSAASTEIVAFDHEAPQRVR